MTRNRWQWILITAWSLYIVLATCVLIDDNALYYQLPGVHALSSMALFALPELLWMPGYLTGFIFGATQGFAAMLIAQLAVLLAGNFMILKVFGLSMRKVYYGFTKTGKKPGDQSKRDNEE